MAGRFLSQLTIILVLNLLVKPLYILWIEVSVQNTVGPSTYGMYFALLNSAYLFQILNDFGLQVFSNREIARNSAQANVLLPQFLGFKVLLALVFVTTVLLFGLAMGYGPQLSLLLPIALNLVLVSLILFLRSGISGLGLYRTDSLLSVLDKILLILLLAWLLFGSQNTFTIGHFIYAQMASLVVTVLVCLFILRARGAFRTAPTESDGKLSGLIRQALPFAVAVFLMGIYTRIDGVMVEKLSADGAYEAGMYAAGYRLLDAANMFAYLFAVLLLPMFSRLEGRRAETVRLIDEAFRSMLFLTLIVSLAGFANRAEIMGFLYSDANRAWGTTFGVLILSFLAVGMMYVFGTLLTARGDIRKVNWLYFGCVVLNIALNAALIPSHGALGAALATLVTQVAATLMLAASSLRLLSIRISGRQALVPLAFLGACILLTYATSEWIGPINWLLRIALQVVLMALAGLLLRIVDIRELQRIFTEK